MNRRKLRSKGMTRRMFYWNIQNMKSMYLNMRWIWRGDYSNESVSCCLWSDDWLSQFFVCGDIVILRWKFRGKRNKHWGFEYFVRSRINQPISFRGFGHVPCKWYVGCDERKKWRLKSEVIVRRLVGQDTWKFVEYYTIWVSWFGEEKVSQAILLGKSVLYETTLLIFCICANSVVVPTWNCPDSNIIQVGLTNLKKGRYLSRINGIFDRRLLNYWLAADVWFAENYFAGHLCCLWANMSWFPSPPGK